MRSGSTRNEINSTVHISWKINILSKQNRWFLSVARSLEIKEISRDVEANDVDTLRGQDNKKNNHQNIETGEKDNFPTNQSKVIDEIGQTNTKVISYKDRADKYQCNENNHQDIEIGENDKSSTNKAMFLMKLV